MSIFACETVGNGLGTFVNCFDNMLSSSLSEQEIPSPFAMEKLTSFWQVQIH